LGIHGKQEETMLTYTVKSGDTLSAIARRLGVPLHLLIEVNNIRDINRIRVGQVLQVPGMTTDTREHPEPPPAPAPVPAPAPLAINRDRFALPPSQYMHEETEKDLIIVHFTAGSTASGAFSSWMTTDARVATAYILDLDGTIYELFDPRYWAYHLGIKGAASQNFRHDRRSIGIEIVNVGPLKERDGALFWWPNDFRTRFCGLDETDKYVKKAYRGFQHYAAYTPDQSAALGPLVDHLRQRFSIPKRLPSLAQRERSDPSGYFKDFRGIASHQNFRADKFDTGPALDWGSLGV
jgi:N-acetyl-anhydromuramyl-L-alanine amidase AmpD